MQIKCAENRTGVTRMKYFAYKRDDAGVLLIHIWLIVMRMDAEDKILRHSTIYKCTCRYGS